MKKLFLYSSLLLLLSGCDEIREFKVNYQAPDCIGIYSVHCTDIRIQQAIFKTKKFRQEFIDGKQSATAEFGEDRYQQLLGLIDQKIKHLQDQRPHLFYRLFKGDETYYADVDYGDAIDAEVIRLVHENERRMQANQSASQPVAETPAPEAVNLTEGEPIKTASVQNDEFVPAPPPSYKYPYTFKITAPTSEEEVDQLIYTVIHTTKGTIHLNALHLSAWQDGIFRETKVGDCIYFTTNDLPTEKVGTGPFFESYISEPEHVSCESI
ncbi:hypothetical protein [Acinetobacter ursingii]|uniref:hypothetical protein n=1 Tax=Acinetobacter ursingii TaxID=108980 RepID=UPI0012503211|nr:hypothetical protein [Acinetobacter ursingii]